MISVGVDLIRSPFPAFKDFISFGVFDCLLGSFCDNLGESLESSPKFHGSIGSLGRFYSLSCLVKDFGNVVDFDFDVQKRVVDWLIVKPQDAGF